MLERLGSALHWRLSVVLLALFVLFLLCAALILRQFSARFEEAVVQRLNRDVAMYVSQQRTIAEPAADRAGLAQLFRYVMIVNPALELYLLDSEGRVVAHDTERGPIVNTRVALDPVRAFLATDARLPIHGVDPRGDRLVVFSAAPVGDPAQPSGYVYAVIGGAARDAAASASQRSFAGSEAVVWLTIVVLFLFATGGLLFRSLTGRLRDLAQRVDRFEATGVVPSDGPATPRGGDELTRLAAAFDAMSAKISAQFAQIEANDLRRREAVVNASHDLRTPLAALQGYLQTLHLKNDSLSSAQRAHYLEIAGRHADRIHALIEQMFALAKLESPETAPKLESFSLAELASDVLQQYRLRAAELGISVTLAVDSGAPPVSADIGMIERLLDNLIDNALKFTPRGGMVQIGVASSADGALELSVTDSGCGIDAADLPHVFERFRRGHAASSNGAQQGSGLGLAIVRRIVELHGARVEAASRAGEGTRIAVRFDCPPASAAS